MRKDDDLPAAEVPAPVERADAPHAVATARERSIEPLVEADPPEKAAPPTRPVSTQVPQENADRPAAARDIRLALDDGDTRRVEVRLVESGGQLRVAVRTPDERLAGSLRDHLATLSSRLEETGFHADHWRTVEAPVVEKRNDAELASAFSGDTTRGDERQDSGGQGHRRHAPPDSTRPEEKPQKKGTGFEWLLASLQ